MRILFAILVVAYAGLMATAALLSRHKIPAWLIVGTFAFSLCLLSSLFWPWAIPLGLAGLLAAAVGNGLALYGHVHWPHVLVRVLLSVIILGLWWKIQRG